MIFDKGEAPTPANSMPVYVHGERIDLPPKPRVRAEWAEADDRSLAATALLAVRGGQIT